MDLSNITVNAQSSIKIAGTKTLYFDPFKIMSKSNDADIIFITHEHYDHYDPESIDNVIKDTTVLVAPESMKNTIETRFEKNDTVFLKPDHRCEIAGLAIEAVSAYNVLKPFHPKGKEWLGYVVSLDGLRYYVAGDTDVNSDIEKVKCDVAIIPIGGTYTMNRKQAANFIANIKPKAVVPTHYGDIVGNPDDGANFKEMLMTFNGEIQVDILL